MDIFINSESSTMIILASYPYREIWSNILDVQTQFDPSHLSGSLHIPSSSDKLLRRITLFDHNLHFLQIKSIESSLQDVEILTAFWFTVPCPHFSQKCSHLQTSASSAPPILFWRVIFRARTQRWSVTSFSRSLTKYITCVFWIFQF